MIPISCLFIEYKTCSQQLVSVLGSHCSQTWKSSVHHPASFLPCRHFKFITSYSWQQSKKKWFSQKLKKKTWTLTVQLNKLKIKSSSSGVAHLGGWCVLRFSSWIHQVKITWWSYVSHKNLQTFEHWWDMF